MGIERKTERRGKCGKVIDHRCFFRGSSGNQPNFLTRWINKIVIVYCTNFVVILPCSRAEREVMMVSMCLFYFIISFLSFRDEQKKKRDKTNGFLMELQSHIIVVLPLYSLCFFFF